MKGMMKALFGMAISAGVFAVKQATEALDGFTTQQAEKQHSESLNAGFVIDHDGAVESRDAALGDVLIQKFDEMVLVESSRSEE